LRKHHAAGKKTPKAPVPGKDSRPIPLPGAFFMIKPARNAPKSGL
jgi:hypothetical protein